MTGPRPRVVSVALLPQRSVSALITQAKNIVEKMTGNPLFPSPTPPLAVISADIVALEASQLKATSRAKGAVEDRNAKELILVTDLHHEVSYVQTVARASDPASAEAIVTSAGFNVKKVNPRPKQDFEVKLGATSGTVRLVARAVARRASYDWQYSQDDKTWISLPTTLRASCSVTALTPATTYFFRGRSILKTGISDWGQPVSILVK